MYLHMYMHSMYAGLRGLGADVHICTCMCAGLRGLGADDESDESDKDERAHDGADGDAW